MEKVFEIYIKTTPERLWEAITDPELRRKYNFGVGVESDWTTGSRYEGAARPAARRSSRARTSRSIRRAGSCRASTRSGARTSRREGTSRVTWEIEPVGDSCRLTVTHDQLREGANEQLYGGWPMILSGLKTLLETGETLTTPARCSTRRAGPRRPSPERSACGGEARPQVARSSRRPGTRTNGRSRGAPCGRPAFRRRC